MSAGLYIIAKNIVKGLGDVFVGVGSGLFDFGKKYAPAAANKMKDLFSVFGKRTNENNETRLPEIKISIVAPSGFGKTTLLSTLIHEIEKGLPKNITVSPADEADKSRLLAFDKKINTIIQAKIATNSIASFDPIEGTNDSHNFNFDIKLSDGINSIVQPFNIMDIPGGWINPDNRQSESTRAKWQEFEKHLQESLILWIPIDSGVLCEPTLQEEKEISSQLLDTVDVEQLALLWAKNRNLNDGACVCYVPVKCEGYYSKDTSKNKEGATKLRNIFDTMYSGVINTIKSVPKGIKQYFIPVETIGCIILADFNWENSQFNAEYRVDGDHRDIKNADKLLKVIYEVAHNEIVAMANNSQEKINSLKSGSFIDKMKNKKFIDEAQSMLKTINETLAPIVAEFGKMSTTKIEEIL